MVKNAIHISDYDRNASMGRMKLSVPAQPERGGKTALIDDGNSIMDAKGLKRFIMQDMRTPARF